jgi:hypothetical protein
MVILRISLIKLWLDRMALGAWVSIAADILHIGVVIASVQSEF